MTGPETTTETQKPCTTTDGETFEIEDYADYGHDPDLDENGICRICGAYEPE